MENGNKEGRERSDWLVSPLVKEMTENQWLPIFPGNGLDQPFSGGKERKSRTDK